jgi:Ser/Thr protein kinase RdoA (MazF antagonist)
MDNWQKLFTAESLDSAAACYAITGEQIAKVGGFENLVYSMKLNDRNVILRVTHDSHRTEEQVLAELNFVAYLAGQGVHVCRPLPSPSGRLLESIPGESGTFLLTAFERAPGGHVHGGHPEWNESLFREWGRITGLMHACALNYSVPKGGPDRDMEDDPPYDPDSAELPAEMLMLHGAFKKYEEKISRLPRSKESYGMCHRDLHQGNFHADGGVIHAFDFDDCGYDYFVHDIAMAVYYAATFPQWSTPAGSREQTTEAANRFLASFMEGYNGVHRIEPYWMKQLPLFIEKRRIDLCMILGEEWSAGTEGQRHWLSWNLKGIAEDQPCMDLELD